MYKKTFMTLDYYIRLHFNYCCYIWGNYSQTNIITMTKLQKIAARLILDCDYSVSLIELFKTLNWQPFDEIVKYNQTLLVYKCLNNSTKLYVRLFAYSNKNYIT